MKNFFLVLLYLSLLKEGGAQVFKNQYLAAEIGADFTFLFGKSPNAEYIDFNNRLKNNPSLLLIPSNFNNYNKNVGYSENIYYMARISGVVDTSKSSRKLFFGIGLRTDVVNSLYFENEVKYFDSLQYFNRKLVNQYHLDYSNTTIDLQCEYGLSFKILKKYLNFNTGIGFQIGLPVKAEVTEIFKSHQQFDTIGYTQVSGGLGGVRNEPQKRTVIKEGSASFISNTFNAKTAISSLLYIPAGIDVNFWRLKLSMNALFTMKYSVLINGPTYTSFHPGFRIGLYYKLNK